MNSWLYAKKSVGLYEYTTGAVGMNHYYIATVTESAGKLKDAKSAMKAAIASGITITTLQDYLLVLDNRSDTESTVSTRTPRHVDDEDQEATQETLTGK